MSKNNINSYTGITEKDGIVAIANVDEILNPRTGDVDEKMSITFFSKSMIEIGFAKVTNSGYHTVIKGDYHGNRLAKKFGFVNA